MKNAVVIIAILLPLPLWAGDAEINVPDRFVGHWAGSVDSCVSDADDMKLRIGTRHISYWESEGPIRAAVVRGDNELALIAELSSEGETWLAIAKFEIGQDGRTLIDRTTEPDQEIVRYKCSES